MKINGVNDMIKVIIHKWHDEGSHVEQHTIDCLPTVYFNVRNWNSSCLKTRNVLKTVKMPILTQIIGISKPNKTNCKNIILNIIYNVIIYQNTNLLHFVHVSNFLLSLVQVGFELWVQSVLTYLFGYLDSRKFFVAAWSGEFYHRKIR